MNRRQFLLAGAGFALAPATAFPAPVVPKLTRLRLANAHTGETFDGPYRNDSGPIADAIADLSRLFRDHHSGRVAPIDVGVIDFLAAVMDAVGQTRATILSGYRTRETNAWLASTRFGVADLSQHIFGRALDVRLDTRLADAAVAARAMGRGGVGWYPRSGFIHLDSGPPRYWTLGDGGLLNALRGIRGDRLEGAGSGGYTRSVEILRGSQRSVFVPGRPPTVAQRMAVHRQIARAQYLARAR